MIILWVRKRKTEKQKHASKNDVDSFQKHDEIMKKFRLSHPEPEVKITSAGNILTSDGNLLAPIYKVRLGENVKN
jgi:hypothetical protein